MSLFQNIFRGARDALTGRDDTVTQSTSSTATNEENSPAADAVEPPKKRGRLSGSKDKKTMQKSARKLGISQKLAQQINQHGCAQHGRLGGGQHSIDIATETLSTCHVLYPDSTTRSGRG